MSKDDASARELAEIKAYLEKRIVQLQEELDRIQSIVRLVDSALLSSSFKRMELPPTVEKHVPAPEAEERIAETELAPVTSKKGVLLANMEISEKDLVLTPVPGLDFDVESPPFRSFLVGRILEPMKTKDSQLAQANQISNERVLSYELDREGVNLRKLVIRNYGDQKRLQDLRNAIIWTLATLHEKKIAT